MSCAAVVGRVVLMCVLWWLFPRRQRVAIPQHNSTTRPAADTFRVDFKKIAGLLARARC